MQGWGLDKQVSRTGAEERLTPGRPDSSSPCHRQAVRGPSGWGHRRMRNRRQGLAFGPVGFPMAQQVKTPPAVPDRGDGLAPWVREIPWRRKKWKPTALCLPKKSCGREPAGHRPWGGQGQRVGHGGGQHSAPQPDTAVSQLSRRCLGQKHLDVGTGQVC